MARSYLKAYSRVQLTDNQIDEVAQMEDDFSSHVQVNYKFLITSFWVVETTRLMLMEYIIKI